MDNIKQKFKQISKYFEFLINKILLKESKKTNNIFHKKIIFKVSNFNKALISLITILFAYLFYLSIPSLYDKTWVQNTIERKLLNKFNINFSISSQISYEILPSPHFTIKNAKIFDDNSKQLSDIKKLKVFISQKNLFNKEKLKIKNIKINNGNFSFQKSDFKFLKNFINKKFSRKNIHIKNSNFFYKDSNNETILIIQMSKLLLFYDNLKLSNNTLLKGVIFNTPFTFELAKSFKNKENNILINSNKLKIKIQNKSIKEKESTKGSNELSLLNLKLLSEYEISENILLFKSKKTQLSNDKIKYNGKLNLSPFDLVLNIDLEEINLKKLLNKNSIFLEFIRSGKIFNKNLSSIISINSSNIKNNKLFDSLKIIINQKNGSIDFNESQFINNKIGILKLKNSVLTYIDNDLILNSDFNFNIKNSKKFYNYFQSPKKIRNQLSKISFNSEYNVRENKLKLYSFKIDDIEAGTDLRDAINNFNNRDNSNILNLIEFKNLVNQLLSVYKG